MHQTPQQTEEVRTVKRDILGQEVQTWFQVMHQFPRYVDATI